MEAPSSEMRSWRACSSTSTSSTAAASSFTWLMGRPLAHGRVEGEWGNREVPPLHQRRGFVGETWFPPRERAEGERRSWVDAARLQGAGDLVDAAYERGLTERDVLGLRELPHAVERVPELVGEPGADLVARPEEPAQVLHPLEVRDRHAAGVREHVR